MPVRQPPAHGLAATGERVGAYRRPYHTNAERIAALQPFLDDYNYARPHTAIGNQPPASRL